MGVDQRVNGREESSLLGVDLADDFDAPGTVQPVRTDLTEESDVHRIAMAKEYHCSTKVDRSPDFIQELMDLGEQRAAEFRPEH